MSSLTIRWLPNGHVPHGYRKVFVVSNSDKLQYVIVLSFMGYEDVFNVKAKVPIHEIQDPALLWGLSYVKSIIGTPLLLDSEDGYISTRSRIVAMSFCEPRSCIGRLSS